MIDESLTQEELDDRYLLVDWNPVETKEGKRTSDLGLLQCPLCEGWWTSLECIGRGRLCCKKCQTDIKLKVAKPSLSVWQAQAVSAVNVAVKKGILPHISERKCEDCGEQANEYHHESYDEDKWLDVTPLCFTCHKIRHRVKKQEKLTRRFQQYQIDIKQSVQIP